MKKENLLIEATALKAGPIPIIIFHTLFNIDIELFCGSICFALALAFTELRPSTAWSHSSGEASFTCLPTVSSSPSFSFCNLDWSAATVEAVRLHWVTQAVPTDDAKSILRVSHNEVEMLKKFCLKTPTVDESSNSCPCA